VLLITYHNRIDSTAVDIMNLSMVTLIDNSKKDSMDPLLPATL